MNFVAPSNRFSTAPKPATHAFQRRRVDFPLLAGLLVLSGIGFLILYSAGGENTVLLSRQATRLGVAYAIMFLLVQIHPHHLRRYAVPLYIIGIALLISVLITGYIGKGAQRWLDLGFFRFQPSEMIKITTPMMICWYLAEHPLPPQPKQIGIAILFIVLPTALIAKQPDLGTALLVASSGISVLFFSGVSWRFIFKVSFAGLCLTPLLWHFMHEYQRARVFTFMHPELDPLGKGYHIIQSKIAIGSGGIYGKGWLNGTQSHLEFLPERSTDFIFAVFAEEFGLLGCLALLVIYLLITSRSLYITLQAQDTFTRLLAGSITLARSWLLSFPTFRNDQTYNANDDLLVPR